MKKRTKNTLVVIVIILLISLGIVGYIQVNNTKSNEGNTEKKNNLNDIEKILVSDIYDESKEMDFEYKAPNSNGKITIPIDVSNCTQDVKYKIIIDVSDIENGHILEQLNFYERYSDSKLHIINNCIQVEGEIFLEDIPDKIFYKDIFWEADLVTDVGISSVKKKINIRVIIKPINAETSKVEKYRLADVVEIGDYVNYDASSNGRYQFYFNNTEYSTEKTGAWRVFSVNKETGEVLLTTEVGRFSSRNSDRNISVNEVIEQLNKISEIYGRGVYATGGRSITIEDIENNSSYDKSLYKNEDGISYGEECNIFGDYVDEVNYEIHTNQPYTVKQTAYKYKLNDYINDKRIIDMLVDRTILASLCIDVEGKTANYSMFCLNLLNNELTFNPIFSSNYGYGYNSAFGIIMPIISLEADVKTTGQDEIGIWQLCE